MFEDICPDLGEEELWKLLKRFMDLSGFYADFAITENAHFQACFDPADWKSLGVEADQEKEQDEEAEQEPGPGASGIPEPRGAPGTGTAAGREEEEAPA